MARASRFRRALPAAWGAVLVGSWMTGKPALPAAAAWCCLCLHAARPAARRLPPSARAAVLAFGASAMLLIALAQSGAFGVAPRALSVAEAARAEQRAAVARSIAAALKAGEASWRETRDAGSRP